MISFLAIAGIFGASSAIVNNEVKETPVVEKAEAASYVFYFVPNDNWVSDNATFKIDFRDSSGNWKNMRYGMSKESYTTKDGKAVYKYTLSNNSGVGTVYFARFSSDGNTEWNYTGKCSIDWSSNLYYIDTTTNWKDQVISQTDRLPDKIETSTSASSNTGRVFVNNYGSGWTDGNVGVRCWGGSATSTSGTKYDATIYCTTWFQDKTGDDTTYYGYADIPTNITGFQFVKLSAASSSATIWNYQNGNSFDLSAGCFAKVYYVSNGWSSGADISTGGAKGDKAYSTLLSRVYEAYDTCSDSGYNGYNAATDLNTYFYSHAQDGAASTLVTSLNGSSKTIAVHQAAMEARKAGGRYNGAIRSFNPFSMIDGESGDNATTIIIIIAASVSLLSITALSILLVKKRKRVDN